MYFCHTNEIWADFPELVAGVAIADGIAPGPSVAARVDALSTAASARLATRAEGALPEIQAWRRAFARMGLRPTQYRCAAESLLRRFRKQGGLPRIHPLIDLCNALSLASAIPIAVFDVARITGGLEVRRALGSEIYLTLSGEVEHPETGEVIFVDGAGRAHARRWSNRQSGHSAVRDETAAVLVVVEAMHESGRADVAALLATLVADLRATWAVEPMATILSASAPRFDI